MTAKAQTGKGKAVAPKREKAAPRAGKAPKVAPVEAPPPPLTTATSAVHVGTKIGPVFSSGVMHFSPFDLMRYELAQQRVVSALQQVGMKQQTIELAKKDFEERLRAMGSDAAGLAQEAQRQQQSLLDLQTELATLYRLDFSKVTYDDVSGRIMLLGEPVPEEDSS